MNHRIADPNCIMTDLRMMNIEKICATAKELGIQIDDPSSLQGRIQYGRVEVEFNIVEAMVATVMNSDDYNYNKTMQEFYANYTTSCKNSVERYSAVLSRRNVSEMYKSTAERGIKHFTELATLAEKRFNNFSMLVSTAVPASDEAVEADPAPAPAAPAVLIEATPTEVATLAEPASAPADAPVVFKAGEKRVIFALVYNWGQQTLTKSSYKLFFRGSGRWEGTYLSSDKRVLAATLKTLKTIKNIKNIFPRAKTDYAMAVMAYALMERAGICHVVEDVDNDGNVVHRHVHMTEREMAKLEKGFLFLKDHK